MRKRVLIIVSALVIVLMTLTSAPSFASAEPGTGTAFRIKSLYPKPKRIESKEKVTPNDVEARSRGVGPLVAGPECEEHMAPGVIRWEKGRFETCYRDDFIIQEIRVPTGEVLGQVPVRILALRNMKPGVAGADIGFNLKPTAPNTMPTKDPSISFEFFAAWGVISGLPEVSPDKKFGRHTARLSWWIKAGMPNFQLNSTVTKGKWEDVQITGSSTVSDNGSGKPTPPDEWMHPDRMRCDWLDEFTKPGCVDSDANPELTFARSDEKVKTAAQHIWDFYHAPADKLYPYRPGVNRTRWTTRLPKGADGPNRAAAKKHCIAKWGPNYTEGGKLDCDEFPAASTVEGCAWAETTCSARPIPYSHNRSAGATQGNFYTSYRIFPNNIAGAEKDLFTVDAE